MKVFRPMGEKVEEEGGLKDKLAGDVAHHEGVDEGRIAAVGAAVQEVGGGRLGAQCQCALWGGVSEVY